jgi:tyrosine-protein kinase
MSSRGEGLGGHDWLAPQGPREGLGHYLDVIRERKLMILISVVLATAIAGVYVTVAKPTWTAESRLLVTPVNTTSNLIGLGLITTSASQGGETSTAASLVTTPEVGGLVASKIGKTTARTVLGEVTATPVAQSNLVAITASASSPARAQALANDFAQQTVENRTQILHSQLDKIIPTLQAQVQALPPSQRTGAGSLGERLSSLETLRAGPDPTISVSSLAQIPTAPSSPRKKLSIVVGVLVGLVVGIGGAFALDGLDPRVRREEVLRRIFRLPVLARIPRERRRSWHGAPLPPREISPAAQESYRMLRVALDAHRISGVSAQDVGRRAHIRANPLAPALLEEDDAVPTRSLMVTGSARAEGKSTVALNLAAVLAAAGHKVILVEADMHRPSLGDAVGMRPQQGLFSVMMGEADIEDALVTVDGLSSNLHLLLVEASAPQLPDGPPGAPGRLVERAKEIADYVIVDAPPVTEVSDAMPLSDHVDSVLIVARLGHSRTDQLVNLGEILMRHGVRPAGLVIVGSDVGRGTGYYSYASPKTRGIRQRLTHSRA